MPRSDTLRTLALAALGLLCGCGPPDEVRPELHPAQGTLTINGRPAEGALLVFHPADGRPFDSRGTRPTATVDADGAFELKTYQTGDGAPAGDYRVAVLWLADPDSDSPWDKLGGRFADPEAADLRVSVEPGHALLDPIRLEGVPVTPRRSAANARDYDQVD